MNSKDKAISILKESGALREGHFVLASGKHSSQYVQTALITQYPRKFINLISDKLLSLEYENKIDTVMGAAIGAIPAAMCIGMMIEKRVIFAERNKEDKMELRRNFQIKKDERILLIEDVITTGGTLLELKELVDKAGGIAFGIFCVINRSGAEYLKNIKIDSVLDIDLPIYEKDSCPLCLKGVSTYRPGTKKV